MKYRETITQRTTYDYQHKRQSGGRGQQSEGARIRRFAIWARALSGGSDARGVRGATMDLTTRHEGCRDARGYRAAAHARE